MSVVVLVPGYGGRIRAVERWRVQVALGTLATYGGGSLVVSGHRGEAERLAALVPDLDVILEREARTTTENVERSLAYLGQADRIAIASDRLHARRAAAHLAEVQPDLADRIVPATRHWWRGSWIQLGSFAYEVVLRIRWHLRRPPR